MPTHRFFIPYPPPETLTPKKLGSFSFKNFSSRSVIVNKKTAPAARVTVINEGRADSSGQVVIAGQKMLTKGRLAQMDAKGFDILIVDEAHHATSPDWMRIIEHFQVQFRLGLSATPVRGDGRCASEVFNDTTLYIIGLRRLIQLGRLVDAKGHRIGTGVDLSDVEIAKNGEDYNQIQLAQTVNVGDRNDKAAKPSINSANETRR